ncbi:hypothetical protein DFJ74DRAFT_706950 [Hyaloraphidium curvatum]|nr:hypothetical protein DFJ74DRAFT_706950 [Hyaloraphidium curvatum]
MTGKDRDDDAASEDGAAKGKRKVACVPCAQRRRRCDAGKPACDRCIETGDGPDCHYPEGGGPKRKRLRRGLSCASCHSGKKSCDGNSPCGRCVERGIAAACRPRDEDAVSERPVRAQRPVAPRSEAGDPGSPWDGRQPGYALPIPQPPMAAPLPATYPPPWLPFDAPMMAGGFQGMQGPVGAHGIVPNALDRLPALAPPGIPAFAPQAAWTPAFAAFPDSMGSMGFPGIMGSMSPSPMPMSGLSALAFAAAPERLPAPPSPILQLPAEYAATLYPTLPPGLLPPPLVLFRAVDNFFQYGAQNLLHRATFDARVCRGESAARAAYRARFRTRLVALSRGTARPAGKLVPELRPSGALEENMDAALLVSVLWGGAKLGARLASEGKRDADTGMAPAAIDALEGWLLDEIDEVSAWFAAVGGSTGSGLEVLWQEISNGWGSSFAASTPNAVQNSPLGSPKSGTAGSLSPPPAPFSSADLPLADREAHELFMSSYHRDIFDAVIALFHTGWTYQFMGNGNEFRNVLGTIALRVLPMCRLEEWFARGPDDRHDPPPVWIRAEEKLRLVALLRTGMSLYVELRSGPQYVSSPDVVPAGDFDYVVLIVASTRRLANLEMPCNDLTFDNLPSAVCAFPGRDPPVPVTYAGHIDIGVGRRLTHGDASWWMEMTLGSPQRHSALASSFGRVLALGPYTFLTLVGELMFRHIALRNWLHGHSLEPHDLDRDRTDVPPAVLAEARARRAAFLALLSDAESHLPSPLREAYESGDGNAVRALAARHYGERHCGRLTAYLAWIHVLHILVRSPGDVAGSLVHPDERWLRGPEFLECSAHAIAVSRLTKAIMEVAEDSVRVPQLLPFAVLRAGFVHAMVLRRLGAGGGPVGPEGDEVVKRLVESTAACLDALKIGGSGWSYTKQAYRIFEKIVLHGLVPTEEDLEALRAGRTVR